MIGLNWRRLFLEIAWGLDNWWGWLIVVVVIVLNWWHWIDYLSWLRFDELLRLSWLENRLTNDCGGEGLIEVAVEGLLLLGLSWCWWCLWLVVLGLSLIFRVQPGFGAGCYEAGHIIWIWPIGVWSSSIIGICVDIRSGLIVLYICIWADGRYILTWHCLTVNFCTRCINCGCISILNGLWRWHNNYNFRWYVCLLICCFAKPSAKFAQIDLLHLLIWLARPNNSSFGKHLLIYHDCHWNVVMLSYGESLSNKKR